MRIGIRAVICTAFAFTIAGTAVHAQTAEDEVRATVEEFVSAWKAGDSERLGDVVADAGSVIWTSGSGDTTTVQALDFAAIRARDRSLDVYELEEIHSIDVVDDVLAVAKVEIRWSRGTHIDYYTLYRVGDRWRIVTKAWTTRTDEGG